MNSRVALVTIASLSLTMILSVTIILSGCSSGAEEKSFFAANPSKPSVSSANPTSDGGAGFSDAEMAPIGLNLVWSYHHPGKIQQAFEANGSLYLVTSTKDYDHVLLKVSGDSGLPQWTYPLQAPLQFAPTVFVYPEEIRTSNPDELFIVERGSIYCIDDRYGARNYKIPCNFPVSTTPAVSLDNLVVGGYDMRIYGLSKKSRFVTWTYLTGGGISAPPLNGDSRSYVGSEDGKVYSLLPGAGFVRGDCWNYRTLGAIESTPTSEGERIYIASRDTKIHCISDVGDEAFLNWQSPLGLPVLGSPVISGNSLYATLRDDRYSGSPVQEIACLDTSDGSEKWRKEGISGVVASSADEVWVTDVEGDVHCLVAKNGASRWSLDVSSTLEVLGTAGGGTLMTVYRDGLVQRIDRRR
ncbi:MAG: PQQ-like beta-propeller repeat protein [Planctomycetes bacterium]|nr:PQQ-like beta-propeller repeat protein [Planctomycetota bacterium]